MFFGADIDKEILFNTEKIKTFYCDQTNTESIKNLWSNKELIENFDIIIDDGLHEYQANVTFFENSIYKLKINGYYIIEDIFNDYYIKFQAKINIWKNNYNNFDFTIITIPSEVNNSDNRLLVVKRLY